MHLLIYLKKQSENVISYGSNVKSREGLEASVLALWSTKFIINLLPPIKDTILDQIRAQVRQTRSKYLRLTSTSTVTAQCDGAILKAPPISHIAHVPNKNN
jgi:hypothetical protein